MPNRPTTTLFMLMSADGKISTGNTDELDFDQDFPKIVGVREGLQQYYDIEQTTDLWSMCSGKVQAKLGVNERELPSKTPVSFVLIDNKHLTKHGVQYFCVQSKQFVLVTTNRDHPAFGVQADNLHIFYLRELNLAEVLQRLKNDFGCERITVQTGGMLNGLFLREKLFDFIDIVVAPVLVGGNDVATLIDGESITDINGLTKLGVLKLESLTTLNDSYFRMRYKVIS